MHCWGCQLEHMMSFQASQLVWRRAKWRVSERLEVKGMYTNGWNSSFHLIRLRFYTGFQPGYDHTENWRTKTYQNATPTLSSTFFKQFFFVFLYFAVLRHHGYVPGEDGAVCLGESGHADLNFWFPILLKTEPGSGEKEKRRTSISTDRRQEGREADRQTDKRTSEGVWGGASQQSQSEAMAAVVVVGAGDQDITGQTGGDE